MGRCHYRMIATLPAVFFMLIASQQVSAQQLWSGTTSGMTIEQVRSQVPLAMDPSKPNRLLDSGAELGLVVPEIVIVGLRFHAQFFFLKEALLAVSLNTIEWKAANTVQGDWSNVVTALRTRYGPELSQTVDKVAGMQIYKAIWLSGSTRITMNSLQISPTSPTNIEIMYTADARKDDAKL